MMRRIIFLVCLMCIAKLHAQENNIRVQWNSRWEDQIFFPGEKAYITLSGDTIELEQLRMYVSGFVLLKSNKVIWEEKNSYHLLDFSDPTSCIWHWNIPKNITPDQIRFNWGIDSLTQVSGVKEGALDPMHGMYWTWQTGYIQLKLEGRSVKCPARQNRFQLHLGGFEFPNSTLESITLPLKARNEIEIVIPWDLFFEKWDLTKDDQIMSPGQKAVDCAKSISSIIRTR